MTEAPLCPRCQAALPTPSGRGRPAVWCSQRCRRAAYEERRAARTGAIGLRVERVVQRVEKPVWCVEYRDRIVEKPAPPPSAAEAAAIVLSSPPACRIVLEGLTEAAAAGTLPRQDGAAVRAAAAAIVGSSPRACRTVLEGLTEAAAAGTLHRSEHTPTVGAAQRLLAALLKARLLR